MIESFLTYATLSTSRVIVLGIALVLAIAAWIKLLRADAHIVLKIVFCPIPLIPILGPIITFWMFNMPGRQAKDLRASMNHYGRGGRFIGFGSGRFTFSDFGDEAPDRPVPFKPLFWKVDK